MNWSLDLSLRNVHWGETTNWTFSHADWNGGRGVSTHNYILPFSIVSKCNLKADTNLSVEHSFIWQSRIGRKWHCLAVSGTVWIFFARWSGCTNDDRSVVRRVGQPPQCGKDRCDVEYDTSFSRRRAWTSVCAQLRRSGRHPPGKRALTDSVTAKHFIGPQEQPA
jgi:hypothetical protein